MTYDSDISFFLNSIYDNQIHMYNFYWTETFNALQHSYQISLSDSTLSMVSPLSITSARPKTPSFSFLPCFNWYALLKASSLYQITGLKTFLNTPVRLTIYQNQQLQKKVCHKNFNPFLLVFSLPTFNLINNASEVTCKGMIC